MEIYKVGPTEFDEYDIKDLPAFEWVVYWYESAPWEGSGELIGFKDGKLHHFNLGHCSCYGPLDSETWRGTPCEWTVYEVDNFFHPPNIFDCDIRHCIISKVGELLNIEVAKQL